MILGTIYDANMFGRHCDIFLFMIYTCFHVFKTNGIRLEKCFQLFEPSKYLQEILHKENGGRIKLISIAHNEEEEIPLNSISQLWSKIFHLQCTKHVNKHINNNFFYGKHYFHTKLNS